MEVPDLVVGGGTTLHELEAVPGECPRRCLDNHGPGRWDTLELVAIGGGEEQVEAAGRCNQAGDTRGDRLVEAHAATQERAPRKRHGHERGPAAKHRRQRFGSREDEPDVVETALADRAGGTSRRLGHRRGARVDTEGKDGGLAGCRGENRATVTGAHVDRHPLVAGNEFGDLADVHLELAASDDEASHDGQDTGQRKAATANWTANCLHQITTLRISPTFVAAGTAVLKLPSVAFRGPSSMAPSTYPSESGER